MGKLGISLLLAVAALAQNYDGPPPPKSDLLYLLHATDLIETESGEARMEERKKETAHVIPGAASPVRTPLAEPIFVFQSEQIPVNKLSLWRMDVTKGQREIAFPNDPKKRFKDGPRPFHVSIARIDGNLYKFEANQYLDNGEYCVSPEGSQQVFCFQVY